MYLLGYFNRMNRNTEYGTLQTGARLVLFTNTYPYGKGETFLHDEIPFLAEQFREVVIYPLYIPKPEQINKPAASNTGKSDLCNNSCNKVRAAESAPVVRNVPENITVKSPLLPFDHKNKKQLLLKGLFNLAPAGFAVTEFFSKGVFFSTKKSWVFFNYLLMLRTILGNAKKIKEIESDLTGEHTVAYFYWGDKTALLIPFLKKKLAKAEGKEMSQKDGEENNTSDSVAETTQPYKIEKSRIPQFAVRFHGSDIYEEAKGYLPFRNLLYKHIDYAIPISQNGADYIANRYPGSQPGHIVVHRLGSSNSRPESKVSNDKIFRIVSCSHVIELKRVHLIAQALNELGKELNLILELTEQNVDIIQWIHIGDGPLLTEIRRLCANFPPFIQSDFKGSLPHQQVMDFYRENKVDLFVQVSRSEGIPVSIMEAFSFGIPVVATNVGGVGEILAEGTGTLLPADLSIKQLKEVFIKYLNMPQETRDTLRINAFNEWKAHWNAEENYKAFAAFLKSLSL